MLAITALAQAAYAFYALYAGVIFSRFQPRASLILDGVVGGINFIIAPILILAFGMFGVAWGQILGFAIGITLALYMLRQLNVFRYDRSSLGLLFVPLLIASSIIFIGQATFSRWWSVPIYGIIAGIIFLFLMGRRLQDADWEQIHIIVPPIIKPIVRKFQSLIQDFHFMNLG